MTKPIRNYPEHLRPMVVQRRMKNYDPKGHNGNGTIAAFREYERQLGKAYKPTQPPAKKDEATDE